MGVSHHSVLLRKDPIRLGIVHKRYDLFTLDSRLCLCTDPLPPANEDVLCSVLGTLRTDVQGIPICPPLPLERELLQGSQAELVLSMSTRVP